MCPEFRYCSRHGEDRSEQNRWFQPSRSLQFTEVGLYNQRFHMCLFTLPSHLLPRTHTQYVRLQHVLKGKGETTQSEWKAACLYRPKCAQTLEFGTAAERDQSFLCLRKPTHFFQAGPAFLMHPFDRHVSVLILVGNKNFNPIKVMSESAHCTRGSSRYVAQ